MRKISYRYIFAGIEAMRKISYRYIFAGIEAIGALTLACIWLGVGSFSVLSLGAQTDAFLMFLMLITATSVMLITIARRLWVSYTLITFLGIVLLLLGASIAFVFPRYFFTASTLDVLYWIKVSVYSLPAVCIEGGIFTLYIAFVEKGAENRSNREKLFLALAFVLYAIFTVTTNFMAINGTIPVEQHLVFVRIISGFVVLVTATLLLFRKKKNVLLSRR